MEVGKKQALRECCTTQVLHRERTCGPCLALAALQTDGTLHLPDPRASRERRIGNNSNEQLELFLA